MRADGEEKTGVPCFRVSPLCWYKILNDFEAGVTQCSQVRLNR